MRILWLTLTLAGCSLYFGEQKVPRGTPDPGVDGGVVVPADGCGGPLPDAFVEPDATEYYPDAAVSDDGGCGGFPDAGLEVDAGDVWPDAP